MGLHVHIRYLYFNKKKTKREIARELGVHRNTVSRAIEHPEQSSKQTTEKEKPINGQFEEKIKDFVVKNHALCRGDRLTKTKMYEEMQSEGYAGSYSAFTHQVRLLEEELQICTKESFIKLVPQKGSLQVDFGEVPVLQDGKRIKVHAFCAKLAYSKVEFVQVYPSESTEFLFEGLTGAFAFFCGVPTKIIFDNLSPVVKKVMSGTERELQDNFLRFQSFFCFEPVFCAVAKGNEKGRVENLVKYVQNNYFKPLAEFPGYEAMNLELMSVCQQRMDNGKVDRVPWTQLFLEESFLPFVEPYDCARILEAKVDTYQLITVDKSKYSVPPHLVGKNVQVRLYAFKIVVSYNGKEVANHLRSMKKGEQALLPYHFLEVLSRKTRAFEEAQVIAEWVLPPIYETYYRQLKAHCGTTFKATREYIEILRLTENYGIEQIGKLLKDLDAKNQYSHAQVLSLLRYQLESITGRRRLPEEELAKHDLLEYRTSHMSLSMYNELLVKGAPNDGDTTAETQVV